MWDGSSRSDRRALRAPLLYPPSVLSRSFALAALVSTVTLTSVSRADVMPPAGDCEGKSEGTACKDDSGKPGACGTITYSRSFTPPFPDAATQTSERSYFGCKGGAAPKSSAASNSTGGSGKSCNVTNVGASERGTDGWIALGLAFALVSTRRTIKGRASRRTSR